MTRLDALRTVLSGCHLARATAVVLVVGTILNAINQGDVVLRGAAPDFAQLALAYAVPFFVATYAAWAALSASMFEHR